MVDERKIKRRKFLKSSFQAAGGFYLTGLPGCQAESNQNKAEEANQSKVVIAQNKLVRDKNKKLNGDQVGKLLDNAMENLLQFNHSSKAWQRLFNKNDVVGIKVNCLAGRGLSTNYELVQAIVEGLKSAGVAEKNIIIWDRANRDLEKAGYKIQTNRNRLKCYGNDQVGYSRKLYEFGEVGSSLSNILVRQCTTIINVPILKDHGICGVTNALKNYFGAIHNPNKYHDNLGDPFIADVNMLPEIRNKTRLTITDALTAQYEGGPPFMPQWTWQFNGLLVGFDPVALDTVAWDIIEKKRKEKGLPSLKQANREPTYIATAADSNHRLGCNDLNNIKIDEV
ncbi:DUF362 domain-containing protein [candidate division KSB1 bacterium]|nr:DUF362 domain-containing protein [candidate division KSB1 bacterium]MBL7093831.1 DUF362 domain-containing protein [candidate division KSB1 bacterium]